MYLATSVQQAAQSHWPHSDTPQGPAWSGFRLTTHDETNTERPEVEAFIQAVYAKHFGAAVTSFAPVLVSLRDNSGIVAAAGYRPASLGPLFLERYLSSPVEQVLGGPFEQHTIRNATVEVGHLSSNKAGAGKRLILMLGPHLAREGFRWVVTTATAELRHIFSRIGLTPLALGVATPEALGADADQWGSYYDHSPVVVGGFLPQALEQIARRMGRTGSSA